MATDKKKLKILNKKSKSSVSENVITRDYSKLAIYLDKNDAVNLAKIPSHEPCPICNTVLDEVMNKTVSQHKESKRKRGIKDEDQWICWVCCQKMVEPPKVTTQKVSTKPRGWKFMNEFVDVDGSVYFKGIEQPELKGTMDPTKIEEQPKKKKLTKGEVATLKAEKFEEINKIKKELTKELKKTQRKKLETQINKLNKEILKIK